MRFGRIRVERSVKSESKRPHLIVPERVQRIPRSVHQQHTSDIAHFYVTAAAARALQLEFDRSLDECAHVRVQLELTACSSLQKPDPEVQRTRVGKLEQ